MSHVLQYALRISEEFPPSVILNSSFKLLEYVSKLPHDKGKYIFTFISRIYSNKICFLCRNAAKLWLESVTSLIVNE